MTLWSYEAESYPSNSEYSYTTPILNYVLQLSGRMTSQLNNVMKQQLLCHPLNCTKVQFSSVDSLRLGLTCLHLLLAANMPVCCRCNGSGRCKACSCVKSGTPCVDCLPSRNGHCSNLVVPSPDGPERPTLSPISSERTNDTASSNANYDSRHDEIVAPDLDTTSTESVSISTPLMAINGQNPVHSLPSFEPLPEPDYHWSDLAGPEFSKAIDDAYSQIVHWKPNLYRVPSGSSGKKFVSELARLFQAFADASALETIALKAAMTLPALVLQKPHAKSKVREHISCLERRLSLWKEGNIAELLREGRATQGPLKSRRSPVDMNNNANKVRKFSKLMTGGKIRAALRLLSTENRSGPLRLDDIVDESGKSVRDILEEKHPDPQPIHPDAILDTATVDNNYHPILFDNITPEMIRNCAMHTEGSAGPYGMDALCWRRLCTSFGEKSNELCSAIAAFARRICTTYIDPSGLTAYTSCRLVPLDKCPGVRPVGIGEVIRRIVGKAVMKVVKNDLQNAIGTTQLCAGQDAGCEAAIHAMQCIMAEETTEGMILVDATNAFNTLNRQVTLLNCDKICPAMSCILINTYRDDSQLFVDGDCVMSKEGTTQGDPLAMAMYAIGTQPLIRKLDGTIKQVWYADDSAAGSTLQQLRRWWDLLNEIGPHYGYFPNGAKTHKRSTLIQQTKYSKALQLRFQMMERDTSVEQ